MINKIINEWTYQLDSGYPTKESDYEILRSVLREMSMLSEQEIDRTIYQAKGLTEDEEDQESESTIQNIESILANDLKLPADIIQQVVSIYNTLDPGEKTAFNKNFRTHTIESYVNGEGWKIFEQFFSVTPISPRGGMGRGEIATLLGVKNSMPGGTRTKDIIMPGNLEWELKEFGDSSSLFDPASSGLANKFKFTKIIQQFYEELVDPIATIGDPYESLKDLVDKDSAEELKKLIRIFETRFESAIGKDMFAKLEWKKTAFYNWYEGFKELHDIFYKTKLDTDVKDTRLTVNQDGNKNSYWISDDDAEQIGLSAGEEAPAVVDIGKAVDKLNTNIVIWFKRLERQEFVKNPQSFIFELNIVKNQFFNDIEGLIWFYNNNPRPHIAKREEFAIELLSQGRYRFTPKFASSAQGYEYLQKQG
jgi:hypothetical protein